MITIRYSICVIGMVALLLAFGCSDKNISPTSQDDITAPVPEMTLSVSAPDTVTTGEMFSVDLEGEDADDEVNLTYTLSRPEAADSSAIRTITPSGGSFSDAFQVPTRVAGEHTIVYSASDSDDKRSGQLTVVSVAPDSTMQVTLHAPQSVSELEGYVATVQGFQADSDASGEYTLSRPGVSDSTVSRVLTQTQGEFTDSFSVPAGNPGDHQLSFRFTDSDDVVQGEKIISVQQRPEMTLNVQTPSAVTIGESYEFCFSGEQADQDVNVMYTLIRPGVQDSSVTRTLNRTNGQFSDTFSVDANTDGLHQLQYRFLDSDDTIQGTESVSVSVPNDNISEIDITGPSQLYVGQQLEFDLDGLDLDGIEAVIIAENFNGQVSSDTTNSVSGNTYDQTLTKTFSEIGNYQLSMTIIDDFDRSITESKNFSITEQPDNPANITLTATSGRGEQTANVNATDADGWQQAQWDINGSITDIPTSGNTFNSTLNLEELGDYDITLRATDNLGNQYVRTTNAEVLAELAQRTLTANTEYEGIQAQIQLDFDNQQSSGITNSNGDFVHTFTAPKDSVISYSMVADALGLQEATANGQSSGNAQESLNNAATPIQISNSLPGQYPRTSDEQDLASLVSITDAGQSVPFSLIVQYSGDVFDINNVENTIYNFATSDSDPANTNDSFTLEVTHPYLTTTETVSKEVFDRRPASISSISLDTRENTSVVLQDFLSYVNSSIPIISDTLYTADPNIKNITKNGDDYTIELEDGFVGSASVTGEVQNRDGFVATKKIDVNVQAAPKARINVQNSVTNQPVESYMLFLDNNEAVLDSLNSVDGEFIASIPTNATSLSVAEKDGPEVKSFEHRIYINSKQGIERTLAIEDFREYDINRQYVGDIDLFDMKRFKWLIKVVHGLAPVVNLDGTRPGEPFVGLHRPTESNNGMSYDILDIGDKVNYKLSEDGNILEIGDMSSRALELAQETYETKIQPLMESFATPIQIQNEMTYIPTATENRNKAFLLPRGTLDGAGLIAVTGKLPYTNQSSTAFLLQDGERTVLTEEGIVETVLQELTAGMIYFSKLGAEVDEIPSQYRFSRIESIIHNPTDLSNLSKYDKRAGWLIYEPLHISGENIDNILRVPNQIKDVYDSL